MIAAISIFHPLSFYSLWELETHRAASTPEGGAKIYLSNQAPGETMKERIELVNVDVRDSEAMARWAHGMCRGQSVEVLANIYEVEATASAVANAIAKDLPGPIRHVVVKACIQALDPSESAS